MRAVVVDDNALNREIVVRILQDKGMETAQASDAVSGWKEVEAFDPQLVVTDVMMPGPMDGVGLCQLIRACPRYSSISVVMVTASDKRREAERALNAGADILLSKPFSPKELWAQIELLLRSKNGAAAATATPRVFILDDNENECRLAQIILKDAGYDVLAETDPAGAIAALKNFRPNLILLDVTMPRLSGPDFAKVIASDRAIPHKPLILFYSNKTEAELSQLAASSGVNGYASKTGGSEALLRAVHHALTTKA